MRMSRIGVFAAVLLSGACLLQAAQTQAFRYMKALNPPDGDGRSLGSIRMDDELLTSTAADYADLRILDETGQETPCTVRTLREKKRITRELAMPMRVVAFRELPTNRVEIVLQRENEEHGAAALVLHSKQENFEKQVTVHGSSDGGTTWQPLVQGLPIYDYTRFLDLRSSRVELPPNTHAMLKVEISNISESQQSPLTRIARETRDGALVGEVEKASFMRADFRIERIDAFRRHAEEVHDEVVARTYPVQDMAVTEDGAKQETVIRFTSCRGPVRGLRIQTPAVNFSRQVTAEVRDNASAPGGAVGWRRIASGTISRVNLGSYARDAVVVQLPAPTRLAETRLRIANLDSPPIPIEGVVAEGDVMEVVFLRAAGRTYRAFYGAEGLLAPRYDIGAVLQNAQTADTDVYSIGPQEANPAYGGAAKASWINRKAVFTVAVILMVLVLVVVIAKAARGIEGIRDE
jgi:hypothetical protein